MDVLYTCIETHWTAVDISKGSLADDTSGFFSFVCVLAVWKGVLVLYTDALVYVQMQAHLDTEQITNN